MTSFLETSNDPYWNIGIQRSWKILPFLYVVSTKEVRFRLLWLSFMYIGLVPSNKTLGPEYTTLSQHLVLTSCFLAAHMYK